MTIIKVSAEITTKKNSPNQLKWWQKNITCGNIKGNNKKQEKQKIERHGREKQSWKISLELMAILFWKTEI